MDDTGVFSQLCPHCGATGVRRLGDCSVCTRMVCEHCGSTGFARGERHVTHHECLKKHDGFKMIKFVR